MKFIKLREVMELTALGRTSIYNFMAANQFPKNISQGERSVAWLESDIYEWMEQKVAERDNKVTNKVLSMVEGQ